MTISLTKNLFCAAGAFAAALTFTAAAAGPAQAEPRSRTVSYADLDLSRQAGQATFTKRVKAAATAVCDNGLSLRDRLEYRRCVNATVNATLTRQVPRA